MVERVNTSYHSPRNLIPMRWGTAGTVYDPTAAGTNALSVTSLDPNGATPITENQATCRAGIDGNCTIAITDGFTPPVNLVAWEYNRVAKKWFRLGAAAALYQTTCDATFVQSTFLTTENAIILVQSSAEITGTVYTDGSIQAARIGAAQEGF